MSATESPRPALIAQNPDPIREGLRMYGIQVRVLLLQDGPELLPATEPPLMIDLRGQTLQGAAHLLIALQRRQKQRDLMPYLLVNPRPSGILRLIAGVPTVRAAVLDGDDLATLSMWLRAPLDLAPGQLWVNVPQPTLVPQAALTPLFAALHTSDSVASAAQHCAMSEGTAYRVLRSVGGGKKRRSVAEWGNVIAMRVEETGS